MTVNAGGRDVSRPVTDVFDYQAFMARHSGGTIAEYADNEIVYAQGSPAHSLHYIVSGTVKISIFSEQGKEGIIALLGAGSFFGESCLDVRPLRTATITSTSACKIVLFPAALVMRALSEDPAFVRVFLRFILGRTEKLKQDLINQLFNSSEKRLARILVTLANTGLDTHSSLVALPVNQEVLANMVGTTRSRINQFMNKFRKLGYIDYNGQIRVYSSLLNAILSDDVLDTEQ